MLRFAPSPTGDMHIGNLRVAIMNYISAKQRKEEFLIRIEDTDKARNIAGKDEEILEILRAFGLSWDRLVYQSENFTQHAILAHELIKKGRAFYCYCTKEFLEKQKAKALESNIAFRYDDSWANLCKNENPTPSIRIKGASSEIRFFDEIKGECGFASNEIDSFVIIRNDGVPTYNFACSVDDMIYDISYIIRGEDHTSNTPKQILIRTYLGYDKNIQHAHLPIILNNEGKKMSKREHESSVKWLLSEGYLPSAIINYLLSMGNKTPKEIFALSEACEWFDIKMLSKSPVRFDINQLRHINREHLRRFNERDMSAAIIADSRVFDFMEDRDFSIGALGKIYLEEASTINEIHDKIQAIFAPKNLHSQAQEKIYGEILRLLGEDSSVLDDFESLKNALIDLTGLKGKDLFHSLRFILTNASKGPKLNDLYPYLRLHLKHIVMKA